MKDFCDYYDEKLEEWSNLSQKMGIAKWSAERNNDADKYENGAFRAVNLIRSFALYSVDDFHEELKKHSELPDVWPTVRKSYIVSEHKLAIMPWVVGYDSKKTYIQPNAKSYDYTYPEPILKYQDLYADKDGQISVYKNIANYYEKEMKEEKDGILKITDFILPAVFFAIITFLGALAAWAIAKFLLPTILMYTYGLITHNLSIMDTVSNSKLTFYICWAVIAVIAFLICFSQVFGKISSSGACKENYNKAKFNLDAVNKKIKTLEERKHNQNTEDKAFAEKWQRIWYNCCTQYFDHNYEVLYDIHH